MKHVTVILVNWKGTDDTLACLKTLKSIIVPQSYSFEIIVVDNASGEDHVARIRRSFPDVNILVQKENLGFAGGNNVGIQYALGKDSDYVWLLNNDTEVDKNALTGLLEVFDKPDVGIAGSKIYFYKGFEFHHDRYKEKERGTVIWHAGGQVDWANMYASHRGVDVVDDGNYGKVIPVPFVSGCSFMISKDVISQIGMLDEQYFMYYEDFDYCMKAKQKGYVVVYAPKSILWHKNSGSTGRPGNNLHEYYLTRNRLVIGFKYAPIRTKFALFREAIRQCFFSSPIRRKAVFDALIGRMGRQYIWQKQIT
jgi:GT2 family glycosyltransferase